MATVLIKEAYETQPTAKHEVRGQTNVQTISNKFAKVDQPFFITVNGKAVKRALWIMTNVNDKDVVVIILLLEGRNTFRSVLQAAVIAAAVAVTIVTGNPQLGFTIAAVGTGLISIFVPIQRPDARGPTDVSPTYSIRSQGNQARLGEPIPVLYGRNRIFPDYAATPFFEFDASHDQFLYLYFTIGKGQYDIEEINIENTNINQYDEAESWIIQPGVPIPNITLQAPNGGQFVQNVYSAPEVGGSGLRIEPGSGENSFTPFIPICPPGTQTDRAAVDLTFPGGIWAQPDDEATPDPAGATLEVNFRRIDDVGNPVSNPTGGDDFDRFSFTLVGRQTLTARETARFTRTFTLSDNARWAARVQYIRFDDLGMSGLVERFAEPRVVGLRGFIVDPPDYVDPDVTRLLVRIKATGQLDGQTSRRINVICTRQLPRYRTIFGEARQVAGLNATSSIAWAAMDALTSNDYGGGFSLDQICVEDLVALNEIWERRGDEFNYIFDNEFILEQVLENILSAGRTRHFMQLGVMRFIRDQRPRFPSAVFNIDNIVINSFNVRYSFEREDTPTTAVLQYFDENRLWSRNTLEIGGENLSTNEKIIENVELLGVTNENQARRELTYQFNSSQLRRTFVEFETELEGNLVQIGSQVVVSHNAPEWGRSAGVSAIGGTLYMIGSQRNALYTLDPTTGIATRVGSLSGFGVGETNPIGLAAIDNILYMIGNVTDALYTLDKLTGIATRIGNVNNFGVGETSSNGLAAIEDTLYFVGSSTDALFTLDRTTGIATRVGNVNNFGVNESAPAGLASIGNTLYMVGSTNDALYTVDTTTGVATRVGNANQFGANASLPSGLATIGNTLFFTDNAGANDALFTLNMTTGIATRIGNVDNFNVGESSPQGLAFVQDDLILYMVDNLTDALYTVDQLTGQATRVGNATGFGAGETGPSSLAVIGDTLYMAGRINSTLYTLNRTTGVATRVGNTDRFGVNEAIPLALAAIGNTLYMVGNNTDALYTVDITTSRATRVGNAVQYGVGETIATGLAAIGNTLYMIGNGSDRLYTLNTTTGVATRVGDAVGFGVNEFSPTSLTSIRGQLYMTGNSNDALYTVDHTTGIATRIGNVEDFGAGVGTPNGLAVFDPNTDVIYELDRPIGYDSSDTLMAYLQFPNGTTTRPIVAQVVPGEASCCLVLPSNLSTSDDENVNILNYNPNDIQVTFGPAEESPQNMIVLNIEPTTNGRVRIQGVLDSNEVSDPPEIVASIVGPFQRLYMIDVNTDALYTVNETTGVATRVGNVSGFGVGEFNPLGLAAVGVALYMIGSHTDALYVLNITTGVATRVGNSNAFGVGEGVPSGLATIANTLYMVGTDTSALHSVNRGTGVATRRGNVNEFGVGENSPSGLAAIGNTLYMVGIATSALYTLNLTTGEATRVGNTDRFGVNERVPGGLTAIGDTLYMVGITTDRLYTLNTTTGIATRVGSANQFGNNLPGPSGLAAIVGTIYDVSLSYEPVNDVTLNFISERQTTFITLTFTPDNWNIPQRQNVIAATATDEFGANLASADGLASIGDTLYMFGGAPGNERALYTLEPNTGQANRVGEALRFSSRFFFPTGLATLGGFIYMVDGVNNALYRVTRTQGQATRVGNANEFGVNERLPTALTTFNNTLYMIGAQNNALFTLNTITGEATRVGNSFRFNVNQRSPMGMAVAAGRLFMVGSNPLQLYIVTPSTGSAVEYTRDVNIFNDSFIPTGLAGIGNTLYITDFVTDALYSINVISGASRRVGNATRYGVGESSTVSLTAIGNTLYMTGSTNDALYTLDTTTGIATRVSNFENFNIGFFALSGLAAINDTLYTVGSADFFGNEEALHTISTATGIASRVGNVQQFGIGLTLSRGLAAIDDTLYTTGVDNAGFTGLYSVNPSTGIAARVGSNQSLSAIQPIEFAAIGDTLYVIGSAEDALYTVDTTTGEVTRVGNADQFGVGETRPSGLAAIRNQLYLIGQDNNELFLLDRNTGEAERLFNITVTGTTVINGRDTDLIPIQLGSL